jgi:hypothetical protein
VDWTFYPKNTAPVALDIVWCRFPLVEDPSSPGPKSRPGLVRKTVAKGDKAFIEVCYGTSKFQNYSDADLIIANLADMYAMGLPQATVFQLGRTAIIPWASEWVAPLDGHGPKISHLTPTYCEYLARIVHRARSK